PAAPFAPPLVVVPKRAAARVDLVVVGSSTGGPAALQVIIPALPQDFPAALVLVQHIPRGFSASLAEHLNRRSRLPVKHAVEGDPVIPGRVLVAPAGFELTFRGQPGHVTVHLDAGRGPVPPGGFRPSVDGVMLSAAEIFGARAMGVLLTGMGRDGARGMAAIREKGGPTIAQDEASCVVFGMPKAAIELGAAERVVPLDRVAGEMVRMIQQTGIS
ncbi:chemotaxis response regulator protein-glutamate methylesterase, partial [Desulfofundulus thermobenzoicus]